MKSYKRRTGLPFLLLAGLSISCAPAATSSAQLSDNSMVTAKDLDDHPDEAIEHVIQRKIPGVTAHKTSDGDLVLVIRGSTTPVYGDLKPPLYVLNGLVVSGGSGGTFPSVARQDIQSIKVLKGADAGIYGIEGANGVVVITTKNYVPKNP